MNKKKINKNILTSLVIVLIIAVYFRLYSKVFNDSNGNHDHINNNSFSSGTTFVEEYTGLKFIKIEKGSFLMGGSDKDPMKKSDENPRMVIDLRPFSISTTEVRKNDFALFVKDTGYVTDAEKEGFSWIFSNLTGKWERKKGINWKNPGFEQSGDHPVVHVSFNDAKAFTGWLSSRHHGLLFRLPTEQEWEFAAKEGKDVFGYEYKQDKTICSYVNGADISAKNYFKGWKINSCNDGFVFTAPAGSFNPSDAGLYDILGNVWEWCDSRYYPEIRKKNDKIYGKKTKVVIRGGSFYSKPEFLRFTSRDYLSSPDKRGYDIGFRLVMTGN